MDDDLLAGITIPPRKDRREAVYFRAMDYILYLQQDGAYVADRVDEWLTLLRDPVTRRPIGVKLKGFHHVYLQMKKVREVAGAPDIEKQIPFRTFIAMAETLTGQIGGAIVTDAEIRRLYDAYEVARQIVGAVTVSADEIKRVEAA